MTWPTKAARVIADRSGGVCEGCGAAEAVEMHHRKFKSRGGLDVPSNALHLCGWGNHTGCHGKAHSATPPAGWALHSWEDPQLIPASLAVGTFFLTNAGRFVATDQIPPF